MQNSKLRHIRTTEAGAPRFRSACQRRKSNRCVVLLHALPSVCLGELPLDAVISRLTMATVRREQQAQPGHPAGAKYRAAATAPASHCSAPRARQPRCHSRLLHRHCPPWSPAASPQHRNHRRRLVSSVRTKTSKRIWSRERERTRCRPRRRREQAAHAHKRCAEAPRTAPLAEPRADCRNIIPLLSELATVVLAITHRPPVARRRNA